MNSKRKYRVAISDAAGISIENITFKTLLNSSEDAEFIYAMRDILDKILDLKEYESIYFQPNRDDKSTHGIIRRVD
jgi:hypothetical protein